MPYTNFVYELKGYDCERKPRIPAPKIRSTENKERKSRKRKQSGIADKVPAKEVPLVEDGSTLGKNIDFEYPASLSPADTDTFSNIEVAKQTECKGR